MKGKLYGIGLGPGDPELLTLKAVKTIQKCGVIAVPDTGNGARLAYTIAEGYLAGKKLLECRFAMVHDMAKRMESRHNAAEKIMEHLECGDDVGFISLGDPVTYSTYMYVHRIITSHGFEAEIIPGITSYSAAAAAFGVALCDGNETLTLIAGHGKGIDDLLEQRGNKAIMKSGTSLRNVLDKLKTLGYGGRTRIACHTTMGTERLYESIEEYEESPEADYFTIALVREND